MNTDLTLHISQVTHMLGFKSMTSIIWIFMDAKIVKMKGVHGQFELMSLHD